MTVQISYHDSNAPLATWDAHLAFIHLPEELQEEVLSDARHEAHSQMKELEPEHYQALAEADDSYQSSFSFEKVELVEVRQPGIDDEGLTPSDGLLEAQVKDKDELDPYIRNILDDWIEEYQTAVRKEIDEIQKSTSLSNREFVAFVLAESPRVTWSQAAELMGITEGTFSGKIGDKVRPKIEKAKATIEVANRVSGEQ